MTTQTRFTPGPWLHGQDGYVLVPIEPTDAMQDAGAEAAKEEHGRYNCPSLGYSHAEAVYAAMLAAAPEPPQGAQDGCLCQGCGERFTGDLLVPDSVWARIKPAEGLLCARCIVDRIVGDGIWTFARAHDGDNIRDGELQAILATLELSKVEIARQVATTPRTAPPADARGECAASATLRMLLEERGHRTDGDLQTLSDRCLHLSRGDRDLVTGKDAIIDKLKQLRPADARDGDTEWPECSGDPSCCPENEGYGCCKPNPAVGAT